MLLDFLCQNFFKVFASMFISDISLQFSFFVASWFGFGIRVMVASQNEFGSLLFDFLEEFEQERCQLFSKFLVEFTCEAIWSGLLFVGRFLITVSISVLVMGLLRFSISFWFSFGKLYFSKNLSISSKFFLHLLYWHKVADSSLLGHLDFCVVCCDFSIFISNFVDMIIFPLFLYESG